MHRTQLYLEEDLWQALRLTARQQGTTISDLVRRAARDAYLQSPEQRQHGMLNWIGARRDWPEAEDTETYIRQLRQDHRLERLWKSPPS